MKHLYIIGNGFDIHTGLATRYSDFQLWLEYNYPVIYENMQAVYDIDTEWWNDFEVQLGNLDVNKFISKFTPPAKPIDQIKVEENGKENLRKGTTCYPVCMLTLIVQNGLKVCLMCCNVVLKNG